MPDDQPAPLTNRDAAAGLPRSRGVDAAFKEERFRFLVSQTLPFMVVSASLATMIAVLVWEEHADRAVHFLLLIALTIAARLTTYLLFRTRRALFDRLESWERLYAGAILFSGIAWGSGTFWVLPEAGPVRPVIFIFAIGMCAGASYYASTRARALIATVAAVILPCTLAFLFSDVLGERLAGVGGLILLAAASRFILQTNDFVDLTRQLSVELEEAQRRAEGLARTDFLTGIENRRSFYGQAETMLAEARTSGRTDALVLLDIDRFKRVNDHFGHGCGDEVIRRFAHMLLVRAGGRAVVGRLGGDEFALYLPGVTPTEAASLVEAVRQGAEALAIDWQGQPVTVTTSIGVAPLTAADQGVDGLVARADRALYAAKRAGRNRVISADDLDPAVGTGMGLRA